MACKIFPPLINTFRPISPPIARAVNLLACLSHRVHSYSLNIQGYFSLKELLSGLLFLHRHMWNCPAIVIINTGHDFHLKICFSNHCHCNHRLKNLIKFSSKQIKLNKWPECVCVRLSVWVCECQMGSSMANGLKRRGKLSSRSTLNWGDGLRSFALLINTSKLYINRYINKRKIYIHSDNISSLIEIGRYERGLANNKLYVVAHDKQATSSPLETEWRVNSKWIASEWRVNGEWIASE